MSDGRPDELHPSESLRMVDSLCEPDPRNLSFVCFDASAGGFRSVTATDQIGDIAQFTLRDEVPEPVRVHFETAKNLYAYAWFVYRFHAVAEQQALTSLEFALRLRLKDEIAQSSPKRTRLPRGLREWWPGELASLEPESRSCSQTDPHVCQRRPACRACSSPR